MRKNLELWEKGVPIDLRPAIRHMREQFGDGHWGCGETTERFCYARLHHSTFNDPGGALTNYFLRMRADVGRTQVQRFDWMLSDNRPSAVLKAFYDIYVEAVSRLFRHFHQQIIEIGKANQHRLTAPYIEWAEDQARQLIHTHRRRISTWVCAVCDRDALNLDELFLDISQWKWRAPRFIAMEPSGQNLWDEDRAWERVDSETTQRWLNRLADDYVLRLEVKMEMLSGETAVRMARTTPANEGAAPTPTPRQISRRERGKLETQDRYKLWQKKYQALRKKHPEKTDVWCAEQIKKLDCGKDHAVDTIRKRIAKK